MKLYSSVDNFVVPHGIRFPVRSTDGRLFYRTDIEELFIRINSRWESLNSSVLDLSLVDEHIKLKTSSKFASVDSQLKTLSDRIPTGVSEPTPMIIPSLPDVQLHNTNVFERGQRIVGGIFKDGTGPGAEVEYRHNTAIFSGYNRTTLELTPVKIQGSTVTIYTSGTSLEINSSGVSVKQNLTIGSISLDGNSTESLHIKTKHGTLTIGPQNKKYCNFETSASAFHFNSDIQVSGDVKKFTGGKGKPLIYLNEEANDSSITVSADQLPGNWTKVEEIYVDKGKIWFKV